MAEAIGVASGVLALAVFAFQTSVSLSQIVESFQTNTRVIRELREELEALTVVLKSLQEAACENTQLLSGLNLPLFRCGKACKDFEEVIIKCSAHSGGSRTSFRDWAKLQYMGSDINGFKVMIAGYKSTINIALAEANFRTVAVTANVLKEYKQLITDTTTDLEDHLKDIDTKLEALSLRGSSISEEELAERERVEEEKQSAKQCLIVCAQVSEYISQVQPLAFENKSTAPDTHEVVITGIRGPFPAKRVTASALKDCKEKLSDTILNLETHLQELDSKLRVLPSGGVRLSSEDVVERDRVKEEKESIQQCLTICAEASQKMNESRINAFGDVTGGADSHQVIIATLGDLISANRVTAGDRAAQWLGQMSDATVQELSRARTVMVPGSTDRKGEKKPVTPVVTKFEGNYGTGYKLE